MRMYSFSLYVHYISHFHGIVLINFQAPDLSANKASNTTGRYIYELNITPLADLISIILNSVIHFHSMNRLAMVTMIRLTIPDKPKKYGNSPIGIKITEYNTA